MKTVLDTILTFTNWVWGIPMLIAIAGGGFFLSVRLGFLQFTKLPFILRNTIGKAFGQKAEQGKFSGWQAVTGALASTPVSYTHLMEMAVTYVNLACLWDERGKAAGRPFDERIDECLDKAWKYLDDPREMCIRDRSRREPAR